MCLSKEKAPGFCDTAPHAQTYRSQKRGGSAVRLAHMKKEREIWPSLHDFKGVFLAALTGSMAAYWTIQIWEWVFG